jgi:hypothetical protein
MLHTVSFVSALELQVKTRQEELWLKNLVTERECLLQELQAEQAAGLSGGCFIMVCRYESLSVRRRRPEACSMML